MLRCLVPQHDEQMMLLFVSPIVLVLKKQALCHFKTKLC